MAKFKFYQDEEVRIWVRDFYYIEADTLEDAIAMVQEKKATLEDIEYRAKQNEVEFLYRDYLYETISDEPIQYGIYSCDLEDECKESEVYFSHID